MGSMGLSLDDFCSMTPHEFNLTYRSWHRTNVEQPWEQTRLVACFSPGARRGSTPST